MSTSLQKNCHVQCGLNETVNRGDQIFKQCSAFSNGNCACSCESIQDHVHVRYIYEEVEEKSSVIDKEVEEKMKDAKSTKEKTEILANDLRDKLNSIDAEIEESKKALVEKFQEMKSICKGYNFMEEIASAIRLIKMRISSQYDLLRDPDADKAQIMQEVAALEFTLHSYEEIKRVLH